jgi:hypothetical protein
LLPLKPGPKGPSKMTPKLEARCQSLRAVGASLRSRRVIGGGASRSRLDSKCYARGGIPLRQLRKLPVGVSNRCQDRANRGEVESMRVYSLKSDGQLSRPAIDP